MTFRKKDPDSVTLFFLDLLQQQQQGVPTVGPSPAEGDVSASSDLSAPNGSSTNNSNEPSLKSRQFRVTKRAEFIQTLQVTERESHTTINTYICLFIY